MRKINTESKLIDFIRRYNLITGEETLVIGVSGGADSVCLLHIFARCQKELGVNLHVAHLNHQLRGIESEADASYVSDLADSLGIPVIIDKQDVASYKSKRHCSTEEAARELRYSFFAKVANDVRAHRIAVGHTRDDHVETILMHILRGTGTAGLSGLKPCSPIPYTSSQISVIRPLLDITREETMLYCQQQMLKPRIDSSNLSLSFFRNRLRLELLPLLRQYNPDIDQALLRLSDIAKEDSDFIEQQALTMWDKVAKQEDKAIHLDKRRISTLPTALQRQLLRLAVARLLGDVQDIEANHIEAMRSLLNKPVSKSISLPHSLICHGGYDEIAITDTAKYFQLQLSSCPFPTLEGEFPLNIPGETILPGWRVIATIIPEQSSPVIAALRKKNRKQTQRIDGFFMAELDSGKTGTNLFIHNRQPGDRFQPLGMNTSKKLQDFMVDAKIPLSWRNHIPVVCSPQQIIWVVGYRIDNRVKVTESTKEILCLEFIKST